jgi:uncharacterized phiE125 gp8 family phage protein
MPPVVVTPPTAEPVTLAELKEAAHITHTTEDTFLSSRIVAARFRYELDTRRQLMEATFDWFLPFFSSHTFVSSHLHLNQSVTVLNERSFELPLPPLTSIVSVKFFDTAGVQQTVPATEYGVKTSSEPGRIFNLPNEEWPDLEDDRIEDAVVIRFIAGAALAADVPDLDKQAIFLLAQHWIENREAVVLDDRISAASVPLSYPEIAEGRKIILTG